ncbi:FAD-binding domain-domain-containing protein [Kockovaella imperatae]|uniref:ferric-chelate reductase (NADPH) n=1 Tax=Kockovaella imperatae TaxID=4999 RepID=A0A1Y1ULC3_9TREE|nr:FAD-binding domain-domain-containing protein [Kockovaella imperatae]ORX38304.1 FAD-binding domain-domain-containing protein [Kockovaella imperatae]
MPLMVDPSTGAVIQALAAGPSAAPSVMTFTASNVDATPTELVSAVLSGSLAAATTPTSIVTHTSAALAADASSKIKEIMEKETMDQLALSSSMPKYLLLAMLGLLLFIMLFLHPRFIARVFATRRYRAPSKGDDPSKPRRAGGGDLERGWLLWSGKRIVADDSSSGSIANSDSIKGWTPPPFASGNYPRNSFVGPTPSTTPAATLLPPPHMRPISNIVPFTSALMMAPFARFPYRFGTSLRIPQIAVVLIYFVLVAFAMIWKSDVDASKPGSGYGRDFMRTGWIAMSQIPIVMLFGVRANLVGLCVGKGYERLKVFHKIVGRVIFLASALHVGFFAWKLAAFHKPLNLSTEALRGGLAAWIAVLVIGITSVPWLRQRFYTVFKASHFAGMIALLVGLAFHVKVAKPWCLASAIIYTVSHIFSLCKTRFAVAELVALPNDTTLVTIPSICTGWRAGQHVRIRIPGIGIEGHPFTIASAPDGEGMILLCKAVGGWTRKLHGYASSVDAEQGTRRATIIVEGPYGGLGNTLVPSFSSVLLVAAGSGITHSLSLAHDLIIRAPTGVVRARAIDLVWIVKNEEQASPLFPTLLELVKDAKRFEEKCLASPENPVPVALRIKIYLSRCPDSSPLPLLSLSSSQSTLSEDLEKGDLVRSNSGSRRSLSDISVERGRPVFDTLLEGIADEVIDRSTKRQMNPCGICVAACGPSAMINDVRDTVRRLDRVKFKGVGGVELAEEQFGF